VIIIIKNKKFKSKRNVKIIMNNKKKRNLYSNNSVKQQKKIWKYKMLIKNYGNGMDKKLSNANLKIL
jgi:hypothetical protein